ncbi:hypothetical protein CEF21_21280 [Bacillus sp. FJAT-42376]|nr:hypothetical protein CEF21_21280 [Bacillus sp. FJAT-42376]
MQSTIEIIQVIVLILLVSQNAYAFTLIIMGNILLEYYQWGIFENPKHWFPKTTNFILRFLFGIGPYFYKKLHNQERSWFSRKALYLGWYLLFSVVCILFYSIISTILNLFI